jgi:hypothetical protein
MATVIKPKRSNTALSAPTTSDLAIGEIAINVPDKVIYVRDANGNITTLANYLEPSEGQSNTTFPTGDYGDLTGATQDAFGVPTSQSFDCATTPEGSVSSTDLGVLT